MMDTVELTTLKEILGKGILAASGDNMQPWRFVMQGDRVELWIKPSPGGHFFETGYRTLYLSAGAVIENIRIASSKHGFQLYVDYFPHPDEPKYVALLGFQATDAIQPNPHYEVLHRRCTNRKFYDAEKTILDSSYEKISNCADSVKGIHLNWIKKTDARYGSLSEVTAEADRLRFENKRVHTEFMECIRHSEGEVKRTCDGLGVEGLEAGPGAHFAFKLLDCWPILSFLNKLGFSKQFYDYTIKQMKSSQAMGLISSKSHDPKDYVEGGEVMQRIWHEIAIENLSMQPMEGIPVFLINLFLEGDKTFYGKQKDQVRAIKERFLSLWDLKEENGLLLMFRIGYSEAPSARSLRRPIESFLENIS